MRTRVREEVALSLESKSEGGRHHSVAHDRHMVQRVVETEREPHHKQRRADLDRRARSVQALGRERAIDRRGGNGLRLSEEYASTVSRR